MNYCSYYLLLPYLFFIRRYLQICYQEKTIQKTSKYLKIESGTVPTLTAVACSRKGHYKTHVHQSCPSLTLFNSYNM